MAVLRSPTSTGPGCEPLSGGLLTEPVAAVTSLAFVVAGLLIVLLDRGGRSRHGSGGARAVLTYAALVTAVGIGSLIQHGPDPSWSDPVHDLPLLATLAFVAADAVAALSGRTRAWWWWAVPTVALLPLVVLAPRVADGAQAGVAMIAVALTLARGRVLPQARARIAWALLLLATGAIIGSLSRTGGPLCVPDSVWQGHGVWHVLASAALVVLAPLIGAGRNVGRRW